MTKRRHDDLPLVRDECLGPWSSSPSHYVCQAIHAPSLGRSIESTEVSRGRSFYRLSGAREVIGSLGSQIVIPPPPFSARANV